MRPRKRIVRLLVANLFPSINDQKVINDVCGSTIRKLNYDRSKERTENGKRSLKDNRKSATERTKRGGKKKRNIAKHGKEQRKRLREYGNKRKKRK